MGVFSFIKEKKKKLAEKKRVKVMEQLGQVKSELKVIKAEGQIYSENAKLTKALRQSKKDLFEAKHPLLSGALKQAGKKLKENKQSRPSYNPFLPGDQAPIKGKKKGKGPGEGIFY